jgi:hypothetical protein
MTTLVLSELLAAIRLNGETSLVGELQTALIKHGYPVGAAGADGWWGPDTKRAVAKLQVEKLGAQPGSSAADGMPGQMTLDFLGLGDPAKEGVVRDPWVPPIVPPKPGARIVFQIGGWGYNSYVQGIEWSTFLKRFVGANARKRADTGEGVVFHEHNEDGKYLSSCELLAAGHGSSFGLDGSKVIIGHKKFGPGYFVFGKPDTWTRLVGIPNGDITVDSDDDLLCIRRGTTYSVYTLSSCYAGKPRLIVSGKIPDWFNRFQGHRIAVLEDGRTVVLVHRDVATKGKSSLKWYEIKTDPKTGKKSFAFAGEFVTTDFGDEAEGAMVYAGYVWATSREGSPGKKRRIVATRTALKVRQ